MNAHRAELSQECIQARQRANHAAGGADKNAVLDSAAVTDSATTAAPSAQPELTPPSGDPHTPAARIAERSFPSVFQPWQPIENLREPGGSVPLSSKEAPLASQARHDLYWGGWAQLGLKLPNGAQYPLLSPVFTPESIQAALRNRATLLAANPNMVILSEVRWRTAPSTFLPPDSPYWTSDSNFNGNGQRYGNRRLDIANPQLQAHVAAYCAALIKTGVYDGCMLDLWNETIAGSGPDMVSLVRKVRAAIGESAILVANVNGRLPELTASSLNGMYMEGFGAKFFPDWHQAAANLLWGETHLHKPVITALEGWWQTTGRNDLALMRAITTLSLVFSDGYVLFADPNGPPDHRHDWYPFWDKSLGRPVGPLAALNHPDNSGAYTRQYQNGEAVFNPRSNRPATFNFPQPRRSAATGATARTFTVPPGDGDLFLNVSSTQR